MFRVLKGIAILAGTGLAIGFGAALADRRRQNLNKSGTFRQPVNKILSMQALSVAPPLGTDPVLRIEPLLDRLERLETRLAAENDSLERIGAAEFSIAVLRERAEAADLNMKRLVEAIERLCERTVPAPPPLAFQEQLDRALENPQPQQEFRATRLPRFLTR